MSAHAFYEYVATLSSTGHAEDEGEGVHCLIEIDMLDEQGRHRRSVELEQEAGDLVLFIINPGPNRRIAHSNIWKVDEQRLNELGPAKNVDLVGNSKMYFYSGKP
ncbi:MAG: hypothetical protein JO298_00465 [Verrucomicrobia bacterium]|nr:hypothetical protein [Verrucomicrobiota bacterium]MBV9644662.1 hypothetical protein [Verrucomicrobiota bacterium]